MITARAPRNAKARVAGGVTIVTTTDPAGRWWGFSANSFSPLSIDPPHWALLHPEVARL